MKSKKILSICQVLPPIAEQYVKQNDISFDKATDVALAELRPLLISCSGRNQWGPLAVHLHGKISFFSCERSGKTTYWAARNDAVSVYRLVSYWNGLLVTEDPT